MVFRVIGHVGSVADLMEHGCVEASSNLIYSELEFDVSKKVLGCSRAGLVVTFPSNLLLTCYTIYALNSF